MAVTALTATCWVVRDAKDRPMGDELYPDAHYDTRKEAEQAIAVERDEQEHDEQSMSLRPVLLDAPCWVLTCDVCETTYDVEGEGPISHYESPPDAVDGIGEDDDEWTTDGTRHHCPGDDCPRITTPTAREVPA